MEILLWLVPPAVVTTVAMVWVSWLGRERRGEVDREAAAQRLGEAMRKPMPNRATPPPRPRERSSGLAVRPSRVSPDEQARRRAS